MNVALIGEVVHSKSNLATETQEHVREVIRFRLGPVNEGGTVGKYTQL